MTVVKGEILVLSSDANRTHITGIFASGKKCYPSSFIQSGIAYTNNICIEVLFLAD